MTEPRYKHATCRGSIALGTACGTCERCVEERARIMEIAADTAKLARERHQRLSVDRVGPTTIAVTVYMDTDELRRNSDFLGAAIIHAIVGPIVKLEDAVRHELHTDATAAVA